MQKNVRQIARSAYANTLTNKGKACYYFGFSGHCAAMNAFVIDVFEFCRRNERREGEIAVADLPRLGAESADRFGRIAWVLEGGRDRQGRQQLLLKTSGSVRLICQRCLSPFELNFDSGSTLIVATDEASADELDALLEDEPVEVVVGTKEFNVADLIEDEVLLALPQSPKHEACPSQTLLDKLAGDEKVSPFAVLKNLKQ